IFDVYRTIYERMQYCVQLEGERDEEFISDMGILIGDPASPIMWLLYFADIQVPDTLSDVLLGEVRISHLEQADDIVLFATSRAALQAKLDAFYKWCCDAFLRINNKKSWWTALGCALRDPQSVSFSIGGQVVDPKTTETYVGMKITSEKRDMFAEHGRSKAGNAHALASTIFAIIDRLCLQCPPTTACRLYAAIIDPHLTHGCDVSPDSTKRATLQLERAQNLYLRKLLRAGKRCSTAALFTETGIWPIRYRRADLLVRYLGYLLQRPAGDYARLALADSMELFRSGKQSWYGDVHKALLQLPFAIDLGPDPIEDSGDIDAVRDLIKESMRDFLRTRGAANPKMQLVQRRPAHNCVSTGVYGTAPVMEFRAYLKIPIPEHRTALTRLLLSTHELAIERLRWQGVARGERLCRLCHASVEHPVHALFQCTGRACLAELRGDFVAEIGRVDEPLSRFLEGRTDLARIRILASHEATLPRFAKFVYKVLKLYSSVPM
ncbi:hypothetical protein AURDEDRAFT_32692, partial [Auricularia subglabra TFB-10046 SS5]